MPPCHLTQDRSPPLLQQVLLYPPQKKVFSFPNFLMKLKEFTNERIAVFFNRHMKNVLPLAHAKWARAYIGTQGWVSLHECRHTYMCVDTPTYEQDTRLNSTLQSELPKKEKKNGNFGLIYYCIYFVYIQCAYTCSWPIFCSAVLF